MHTYTEPKPGPILQAAIDRSDQLTEWLDATLFEGDDAIPDRQAVLTITYASLALEHRAAIQLLVHAGAHATAMAATRPALEALVRAVWARFLANDAEIAAFLNDKLEPPGVDKALGQIVKKTRPNHAIWERLRKQNGVLNDYAHGGLLQVSPWMHLSEIAPLYSDEQMADVLLLVDIVGVLAGQLRESELGRPSDVVESFRIVLHELLR